MVFFVIIIILFQIGVSFVLAQKNAQIKDELSREKLISEGKENQIYKLKNQVLSFENRIEKFKDNMLNIKDYENLHMHVNFPVVDMEDETGLMIVRRCKNDCIIESVVFPNYDMGIMASKALTELGFKIEAEYCDACKKDGSAK